MKKIILHIDVNNAFLSWEAVNLLKQGSNIDIRTIPSIIGGDETKRHGVVLAKSNPAKKFNVVTGESLFNARKKCPMLKIYEPHYDIYEQESYKLYSFLLNYSPRVERFSIDECYLDYTGMEKLFGNPLTVAYEIKDKIKELYGWTVNVGIGNNKLCAKMASDFLKPDRVHTLFEEEIQTKLWPLPVNELYMVGKKTSIKLNELDINTVSDLANYDFDKLKSLFKKQAYMMKNYALGIDDSEVACSDRENKGISISTTVVKDLINKDQIKEVLWKLTGDLAMRLRRDNVYASVIVLILRNSNFINYSQQRKILNSTNGTKEIYNEVCQLLETLYKNEPIRLVGIRVTSFSDKPKQQLSLFDSVEEIKKDSSLDKTVDKIKEKYGNGIIVYASLKSKN
jgi:DNA polymerase IV